MAIINYERRFTIMTCQNTKELSHIGILRRSGRYPWGSGKRPYQSSKETLMSDPAHHLEEIYSRKKDFTTNELQSIINRLNVEDTINRRYKDEKEAPIRKAKAAINNIIDTGETMATVYKFYQNDEIQKMVSAIKKNIKSKVSPKKNN